MASRLWIFGSLVPLLAGPLALEACTLDRAGSCVSGDCDQGMQVGPGPGPGQDAGGSEGDAAAGCSTDVDCDDGNPCTTDTCEAGGDCKHATAGDGEQVGGTACLPLICQGGSASPTPAAAGEECDGGGTCDGAGACLLALGGDCNGDAQCDSGHCVEGVCCAFACDGECKMCNPWNFASCTVHSVGEQDPDCADGTVCRGDNKCTAVNGEPCDSDDDCFTMNCDQSGGDGVCQPT